MEPIECAAYALHRRNYRETSMLVELLTLEHGRLAAVARGAKPNARGRMRFDLEPFCPLQIAFRPAGELAQLRRAEADGPSAVLVGPAALAGLYLNELLVATLPREVPHPALYMAYEQALLALQGELARTVRQFEWLVVDELGQSPDLQHDSDGETIAASVSYRWQSESGLVAARQAADTFFGADLLTIAAARGQPNMLASERRLLAALLAEHVQLRALRSFSMLTELRALALI